MFLKDVFFPKVCLGCGALGSFLCPNCQKKLKPIKKPVCFYCKKDSPFGITHPSCLKKLSIDGVISIFYYNPLMKKIIKNIKYRLVREVFDDLFKIIYPFFLGNLRLYKNLFSQGLIQPIPLHKKRFNKRGFNQAKIFSEFLAKIFNLTVVDFLVRKKDTPFLAQLKTKKERFLNIRGAFSLVGKKEEIKDKKIILVDDVITSGATIKEAAKVLKKAGAKTIFVFTLAKG